MYYNYLHFNTISFYLIHDFAFFLLTINIITININIIGECHNTLSLPHSMTLYPQAISQAMWPWYVTGIEPEQELREDRKVQ